MGMVTMKHLAERLGVSVTTVSNAYNKPDRLSAELREKILATGGEMGYCGPDAAGRLLRRGKADSIGVYYGGGLSFIFQDPYASELMAGITEVLEETGHSLSLLATTASGTDDADLVRQAVVDALICLAEPGFHTPAMQAAVQRRLPIVYTHVVADEDIAYVGIDDHHAGLLIGEHLRELGHKRVGVITRSVLGEKLKKVSLESLQAHYRKHDSQFWLQRLMGILEGLGEGAEVQFAALPRSDAELGAAATARLLDSDEPPTALAALSDAIAMGVLDEVESRGLRPGVDVSVSGFDGLAIATARGLTTVTQPMRKKGRKAAMLAIDPERQPRQITLPVKLAARTSTGPAPR
ncbi:LacI family DNA-binding transcriptional regulator [Aestuariimicrobium ganziense]|uniref:LacI family DNA-binding transcriptional regulator n=1 Tax=Aestuariimicrobium ganziense TaxID=2773677 RepID=UPI001942AE4F|nr:substrate-binding domain-containing protein [Aestuariimicrobium ganziense]